MAEKLAFPISICYIIDSMSEMHVPWLLLCGSSCWSLTETEDEAGERYYIQFNLVVSHFDEADSKRRPPHSSFSVMK